MGLEQIKGSSGLLSKITFSADDSDFLLKRQQALEVSGNTYEYSPCTIFTVHSNIVI